MTSAKQISKIVKEMMKTGNPQRLPIRFNSLSIKPGFAIEDEIGLAIGNTFETLEASHAVHSKAWHKAWDLVPA